MTGPRDRDPLEDRLEDWLAVRPETFPEGLSRAATDAARSRRQRPGWLARVRQGSGFARGIRGPAPVVAASVAVVALMVLGVALLGRLPSGPGQASAAPAGTPSTTSPPAASNAPPSSPAEPTGPPALADQATRAIPLDRIPTAVGAAFSSLWVTNLDGDLLRIDPVDGEVVARIQLGSAGCGPIQADAFSVWLQTCGSGAVLGPEAATTIRVDPTINEVVDRYEDGEPDGVGVGSIRGLVWFISGPLTLTGVAADSGEPVRTIELREPVRHLAAGLGSLWIAPIGSPTLVRIDPESGNEQARIPLSGDAGFVATSGDAAWVAEPHQWLLATVDPTRNALAGEYGAAPVADQITFDARGRVWLLAHDVLIVFDPQDGREIGRYAVPAHDTVAGIESLVLAAGSDGIWYGAPDALWFIPATD